MEQIEILHKIASSLQLQLCRAWSAEPIICIYVIKLTSLFSSIGLTNISTILNQIEFQLSYLNIKYFYATILMSHCFRNINKVSN